MDCYKLHKHRRESFRGAIKPLCYFLRPRALGESMIYHVMPNNDLKEHSEDSANPCECEPSVIQVEGDLILVHNSFDGREAVEEVREILNKTSNGNLRNT